MKRIVFLIIISLFLATLTFANVCINWSSSYDKLVGGKAICMVQYSDGSRCSATCAVGCAAGSFTGGGCFAKCIDKMPGVKIGNDLTYAMEQANESFLLDPNSVDIDPNVWNFKSHRQFIKVTILADFPNVPVLQGSNWKLFNQLDPVAIHFKDLNQDGKDDMILKFDAEAVKAYLGDLSSDDYSFFISSFISSPGNNQTLFIAFLTINVKND